MQGRMVTVGALEIPECALGQKVCITMRHIMGVGPQGQPVTQGIKATLLQVGDTAIIVRTDGPTLLGPPGWKWIPHPEDTLLGISEDGAVELASVLDMPRR